MSAKDELYLCLTTVSKKDDAETLAAKLIEKRLAACVQIDSEVTSIYRWRSKIEKEREFRLNIFAHKRNLEQLAKFVEEQHPYDTPKWVCFKAEKVSEKYLKWTNEVCTVRGFI